MKMQRNITNLLILIFVVILIADFAASRPCGSKPPKHSSKPKPPKPTVITPTGIIPRPGPVEPSGINSSPVGPKPTGIVDPPEPTFPARPPGGGGGNSTVHTRAGDGTFFTPDLGACGVRSTSDSAIVALAAPDFDPSTPNGNPNNNALCGKKVRIFRDGKSVDATVEDRCPECKPGDVDMSPAVFNQIAKPVEGRVPVTWQFID